MIFICKAIPYRNFGIFGKVFHNSLLKSTIFYSFIHSPQHSCCICDRFLFSDLGPRGLKISCPYAKVMCCHLKRTSCARACLFKNKGNIFSAKRIMRDAFLFLVLIFSRQINQIFYLFWCEILQCQKTASF